MNFKKHSELLGEHAYLSPSKHSWINYEEDKLDSSYRKFRATQKGTELHDLACRCIKLKIKLPKTKQSLNEYVNDAIGYRMTPEQPLYYSVNSFGTTDAICFKEKEKLLRIHDLKTGVSLVPMHQLEIYAALFCLEYGMNPNDIDMELRIYQSDEIIVSVPSPETILMIMDKIILFDKKIEQIKLEEE